MQGAKKELEGGDGAFFDAIAHRYDLLNRILSMGLDRRWRKKAVEALALSEGDHVLDLATGTGDLAIEIAETHPGVTVCGIDPSENMLAIGKEKVAEKELSQRVDMQIGDGQALDIEDDTFDGTTIAFGIRNFPDRLQGLREMERVTKSGRTVAILELSEPQEGIMSAGARFYVHQCVPRIGSLVSGAKEYRYLEESIAAFPSAETFAAMMEEVGLVDVEATPLTFGVVNLYTGQVS